VKIGCNTLYPGGLLANGTDFTVAVTREALDKLQAVGYLACEYSHCDHWTLDEAREVGAYARERGLQSWSCHTWRQAVSVPSEASTLSAEELGQQLCQCVQVCAALGSRVLVIHAPLQLGLKLLDRDPAELMRFDLAALRPARDRAADLGVELALENGRHLNHFEYVLQLLEMLDAAHVGICVDVGHANLGTLGAARAVRMAGEKLLTTHLHDNHGQFDDHLPPGQGAVAWADVFRALSEVRYSRPLILELSDNVRHRPYDQDLELRQGLDNVRRYCDASGVPAA